MSEENKSQLQEKKIQLILLNGTGYMFDIDDYMTVRTQHRIMGASVGTSSNKGWSASECTLPVALTKDETRLLVEEGFAELVSKRASLLKAPTAEELLKYKEEFEEKISAQADDLKAEKLREAERNMDKILSGKRRKLLKSGNAIEAESLKASDALKEIEQNFSFDRKNALVEIPCADAQKHIEIVHLLPDKSLKYRVFRDCWQRGKFVTSGDAFGADFLLYPGDPVLYHASHVVILLEKPTLRPLDLIAKVRLSVIVNKICVFAYFVTKEDKAEPIIHYQTVSWEGNRDKQSRNSTEEITTTVKNEWSTRCLTSIQDSETSKSNTNLIITKFA